jgi:hypothetical protein
MSGVLTDPSSEQALLAASQSCFVLTNTAISLLLRSSSSSPSLLRLASAVSELRLSVFVLSPVACSHGAGSQLLRQAHECRDLVASLLVSAASSSNASLSRLNQLLGDLMCLIRTSASVVRMKMQSNTVNVAALLAVSEVVTAALQTRSASSIKLLVPLLSHLSGACEALRTGLRSGPKVKNKTNKNKNIFCVLKVLARLLRHGRNATRSRSVCLPTPWFASALLVLFCRLKQSRWGRREKTRLTRCLSLRLDCALR